MIFQIIFKEKLIIFLNNDNIKIVKKIINALLFRSKNILNPMDGKKIFLFSSKFKVYLKFFYKVTQGLQFLN